MTKQQTNALKRVKTIITNNLSTHDKDTYGAVITRCDVKDYDTFLSVAIETEFTKLNKGNLLRALSHDHWHVFVGLKGALTVKSCPKEYEQFHGKRAFGMNFNLTIRQK